MEASLKRTFEQSQQGSVHGGSQGASSGSQIFSDAALMAAYHASWMAPSSELQFQSILLQQQQQSSLCSDNNGSRNSSRPAVLRIKICKTLYRSTWGVF
jgi:hypothetical protein